MKAAVKKVPLTRVEELEAQNRIHLKDKRLYQKLIREYQDAVGIGIGRDACSDAIMPKDVEEYCQGLRDNQLRGVQKLSQEALARNRAERLLSEANAEIRDLKATDGFDQIKGETLIELEAEIKGVRTEAALARSSLTQCENERSSLMLKLADAHATIRRLEDQYRDSDPVQVRYWKSKAIARHWQIQAANNALHKLQRRLIKKAAIAKGVVARAKEDLEDAQDDLEIAKVRRQLEEYSWENLLESVLQTSCGLAFRAGQDSGPTRDWDRATPDELAKEIHVLSQVLRDALVVEEYRRMPTLPKVTATVPVRGKWVY